MLLSDLYSDDRTKYRCMIPIKGPVGSPANHEEILEAARWVSENAGDPSFAAHLWAHSVTAAWYIENSLAVGNAGAIALADAYVGGGSVDTSLLDDYIATGEWDVAVTQMSALAAWLDANYPALTFDWYEFNWQLFTTGTSNEIAFYSDTRFAPALKTKIHEMMMEFANLGGGDPVFYALTTGKWALLFDTTGASGSLYGEATGTALALAERAGGYVLFRSTPA